MGIEAWLSSPSRLEVDATLVAVNDRLSAGGMLITLDDARMLSERRKEALVGTGRVEFGRAAIIVIAEAVATSPCLSQTDVVNDLAELQDAFYTIRDELPVDVPDEEIAEALRGCLDDLGDATEVAALPADELMAYSEEYAHARDEEHAATYRIVDDEGRAWSFDPAAWDYDEAAPGWDGEEWDDGCDD